MAQHKFEGDLNQISPRQLEYISEMLINSGFKDAKVTITPVGVAGDNYVANVKRITVDNNGEIFKIIVKVAPKIEQIRMTMNSRTYFLNEHVMYTEVLPKYTELEKARDIPPEKRLRYATCYGTMTEDYDEMIMLEDLNESGYTMLDRFKPLTDEDIRLVLKNFAKLHSLSYALKYQEPETYKDIASKIVDFEKLFPMQDQMTYFLNVLEQDTILMCDPKYTKFLKGIVSETLNLGKKLSQFDENSRFSVLQQGDAWTNNIMFKLQKKKKLSQFDENSRFSVLQQGDAWTNNIMFKLQEGKSVACCMIDYQLSRVNSPVADLHYMLFNCTDHETRRQHYQDWIDYYHSELEDHLFEFNLKVNYVYPKDQLDADLKRHAKNYLGMAVLLASILTRESESAQELKEMMETMTPEDMEKIVEKTKTSQTSEKTRLLFKSRVEGVIDTCLEFGFL